MRRCHQALQAVVQGLTTASCLVWVAIRPSDRGTQGRCHRAIMLLNGHAPADARRSQTPAMMVPVRRGNCLAVCILLPCRLQLLPACGGLLPLNLAVPCTAGCQMAAPQIVPGVRGSSQSHLQRERQAIAAAWAGRAAVRCVPQVLPFQLQRTGHKTVGPVRWTATNMSKCLRRYLCVTIT
jgi:hypothetical protein